MANTQPNFEILKTCFYRAFVDSKESDNAVILSSLSNSDFRSYYKKKEEFKKDFNTWLDRIDIRQAPTLIHILKDKGKKVPSWMVNREYEIDYNDRGVLDLIRLETNLK